MSAAPAKKRTRINDRGEFITDDGTPIPFLPEIPSNSPPHELVHTAALDEASADGFKHYDVGADADVVQEIVDWYAKAGHPVPDGYAQAAADHAAAVEAARAPGA